MTDQTITSVGCELRPVSTDVFLKGLGRPTAPRKTVPATNKKPFPVFLPGRLSDEAANWPPESSGDQPNQFLAKAQHHQQDLLWADRDGTDTCSAEDILQACKRAGLALPCYLVSTSPNRWHLYWPLADGTVSLDESMAAMKQIAEMLSTDSAVASRGRPMRFPDGHKRECGHECVAYQVRSLGKNRGKPWKRMSSKRAAALAAAYRKKSPEPEQLQQEARPVPESGGYRLSTELLEDVIDAMPFSVPGTSTYHVYRDYCWSTFSACLNDGISLDLACDLLARRYHKRAATKGHEPRKILKDFEPKKTGPEKFWKLAWATCRHRLKDTPPSAVAAEEPLLDDTVSAAIEVDSRHSLVDYVGEKTASAIQSAIYGLSAEPETLVLLWLMAIRGALQGGPGVLIRDGYREPLNCYMALVGTPGSAKSPLLAKMVREPLTRVPSVELLPTSDIGPKGSIQQKVAAFGPYCWPDPEKPRGEKDKRQSIDVHVLATQGTSEGLARHLYINGLDFSLDQDPDGNPIEEARLPQPMTIVADELMAFLGNIGAYSRQQASAEVGSLLSYHDGIGRIAVNAGLEHRVNMSHLSLSFGIVGNIQPVKLAELKASGALAGGGFWPRLLLLPAGRVLRQTELPTRPSPGQMEALVESLGAIYDASPLQSGYRLSPEAYELWGALKDVLLDEWERRDGTEAQYRMKQAALTARMAALLHIARGYQKESSISGDTFALATDLVRWAVDASMANHRASMPPVLTPADWRQDCIPDGLDAISMRDLRAEYAQWVGKSKCEPIPGARQRINPAIFGEPLPIPIKNIGPHRLKGFRFPPLESA